MLGSHNSATGERPSGLLSWLLTPFAQCQSRTVAEQFSEGCRYYDFRFVHSRGRLRFAHGLWRSSANVMSVLRNLNSLAEHDERRTYVMVSYEGSLDDVHRSVFIDYIHVLFASLPSLVLTEINVKRPKWSNLVRHDGPAYRQGYMCLDGHSWHTLIPVPRLWHRVFGVPGNVDGVFTFRDFV